ncbi:MAG: signal peptidase I [Alphaproteobacteria bacterium]|nr:signal peptidase I [Alphaproteobacteria bacterium]
MKGLVTGHAGEEGAARGGWFIGHFLDPSLELRHSAEVEVKWGIHEAGATKSTVGANATATTLSILVSGRFQLDFPELGTSVPLERPGDYALWSAGPHHRWIALEDSVILTVRWPSRAGDQTARPQKGHSA